MLKQLGLVSMLRGTDSTGIYQVNSKGSQPWQQALLTKSPDEFTYFDWYNQRGKHGVRKCLDNINCDIIMGHVRAATVGEVNAKNAHPFEFKNIVGMHNGTLKDKRYLAPGKTDSEQMFADINERGIDAVLGELDPESAYAITMYDKVRKELIIARNKKRPLWVARLKARSVLFWASEELMLDLILQRNGEEYELFNFATDHIYHFNTSDLTLQTVGSPMLKREIGKDIPPVRQPSKPKVKATREATNNNVVPFFKTKKKATNNSPAIIHHSCNYCNTPMSLIDQHYGRQNEDGGFTCEPCVKLEDEMVEKMIDGQVQHCLDLRS